MHSETKFIAVTIIRKYFLVLSFALLSLALFSNAPLASKQQVRLFKNSRTCVVFEDGISFYNAYIRDAVKNYWKSTDYEFIDQREFDKRKTDSKYSFIVLLDEAYDKDPGGISYRYINLILGDASGDLTKMPEFCSIPLSYSGDTGTDYEYVIPAIVKFMQIHVKNLEKDHFPILLNGLKYYNKKGSSDKVLLLNKDKMASDADSQGKIKSIYPYDVKLLTLTEIQEKLASDSINILFLFHVGPNKDAGSGKCFEMIFDITGNMYYYNSRKITNDNPDGFNIKDFKNIMIGKAPEITPGRIEQGKCEKQSRDPYENNINKLSIIT